MSVSLNYTGIKVFRHPVSGRRRCYFYLKLKTSTAILKFGGGDAEISISELGTYILQGCAANTKIEVITAGTYIVHSDNHEQHIEPEVNITALFDSFGVITCSGTLSCSQIIPCGV
tara:strand:- start:8 stop:355 length:348 start_codon:yes stop_codon:yes gene_type:complete